MRGFLAGLILASVGPAAANQVVMDCKPVVLPPCDNALAMHFKNGRVPNRCKIT